MTVLVIAEHSHQTLSPATFATITAARALNAPIQLLIIGYQCESVVQQAVVIDGVTRVFVLDHPAYTHPVAEQIASLAVSNASSVKAVLAPGTTFGKNIIPRIAALLNVAAISDVTQMIDAHTFEHPIYAGNALARVVSHDPVQVMTIRATAFSRDFDTQAPCPVESVDHLVEAKGTTFLTQSLSQSERPSLSSAKIVVSGGRALQSAEKFVLIEQLADVLHAAVGASRAAVDAGFVSNDYQVGQTGQVVAPDLYIAVGISGAIQHIAGMKDSRVIVAINKDEEAPIFQIADYGLVGNLFEIVPELIKEIKQLETG